MLHGVVPLVAVAVSLMPRPPLGTALQLRHVLPASGCFCGRGIHFSRSPQLRCHYRLAADCAPARALVCPALLRTSARRSGLIRMGPQHTPEQRRLLEGVKLQAMVTELVDRMGWDTLADETGVRCFEASARPTIKSALKFLRTVDHQWARERVEDLYLDMRINFG
mmetsp:Transcript_10814/g.32126  ORF Transcript_10814/g.32126 Transcript_10814/m.32126 type:complete len:166 (-) Transcript_10814:108-605(-)